jgi:hypothetical protein
MIYEHYFNHHPEWGLCRNNLIYTSLISQDQQVFVQWYHNDGIYHQGQNQVVDPALMTEKFQREVKYLSLMRGAFPDMVPKILDIDFRSQKIYLEIQGPDLWERAGCGTDFDSVLPNWREQMLAIIGAHRKLGLYKYSMHPSSYFPVNGRLKSINYFFTYHRSEPQISIEQVESHIYSTRQAEMRRHLDSLGIDWHSPQPFELLEKLCWQSFSTNYPGDFILKAMNV